MTYLYWWFALGAAGLALDIFFALLGFGYIHRSIAGFKAPAEMNQLSRRLIYVSVFFGIVTGIAFAFLTGPIRIMFAISTARSDWRDEK
jgi:hypothetical protein